MPWTQTKAIIFAFARPLRLGRWGSEEAGEDWVVVEMKRCLKTHTLFNQPLLKKGHIYLFFQAVSFIAHQHGCAVFHAPCIDNLMMRFQQKWHIYSHPWPPAAISRCKCFHFLPFCRNFPHFPVFVVNLWTPILEPFEEGMWKMKPWQGICLGKGSTWKRTFFMVWIVQSLKCVKSFFLLSDK